MDLSKMCTILLLLALVIIVCRNSSELGIEGYENDLAQDRLLNEIDEDAEDAINIAKEILEHPISEEVLPNLLLSGKSRFSSSLITVAKFKDNNSLSNLSNILNSFPIVID